MEDWDPSPEATFVRRLGGPNQTRRANTCPDVWELSDGNVAIVGVDMTQGYSDRIPDDLHIYEADERLVVVPKMIFLRAAKAYIQEQNDGPPPSS